jgi:hypothetical protein
VLLCSACSPAGLANSDSAGFTNSTCRLMSNSVGTPVG